MSTEDRNTNEHRERAVKALLAAIDGHPGMRIGELMSGISIECPRGSLVSDGDLADALERCTPKRAAAGWRFTEQGDVPAHDRRVLAWNSQEPVFLARYNTSEGRWVRENYEPAARVTAWQPFPKGPA